QDPGLGRIWYDKEGNLLDPTFLPPTNKAGTISYFAATKRGDCESERVEYKINVVSLGTPVLDKSSIEYCINTSATNVSTLPQATNRVWYDDKGTRLMASFKPSTNIAGSKSYFATNSLNGCESEKVEFKVIVEALPQLP